MNSESFENKLYIPRDIEGNPNKEDLEFLHIFQEKLSERKGFVGIAPFGSVVSGYSIEESDVDLYMLYDDPDAFGGKIGSDLWKEIQNLTKDRNREFNILAHNINFEFLLHYIKTDIASTQLATELGAMSRLVTGDRIREYRKKFADELKKLTAEQKKIILNNILTSLSEKDATSLVKRKERMPDLSEDEHQSILNKRKKMWEKRVKSIWNL